MPPWTTGDERGPGLRCAPFRYRDQMGSHSSIIIVLAKCLCINGGVVKDDSLEMPLSLALIQACQRVSLCSSCRSWACYLNFKLRDPTHSVV